LPFVSFALQTEFELKNEPVCVQRRF